MKILLDTSIAIDLIRGDMPTVANGLFAYRRQQVAISTISVAELRAGAEQSQQVEANHHRIDVLLRNLSVQDFSEEAAREYGLVQQELTLSRQADLVDDYDQLIAAHARVLGVKVATANAKDFDRLGVRWENWRDGTSGGSGRGR